MTAKQESDFIRELVAFLDRVYGNLSPEGKRVLADDLWDWTIIQGAREGGGDRMAG
jgi:hypothetical protein